MQKKFGRLNQLKDKRKNDIDPVKESVNKGRFLSKHRKNEAFKNSLLQDLYTIGEVR